MSNQFESEQLVFDLELFPACSPNQEPFGRLALQHSVDFFGLWAEELKLLLYVVAGLGTHCQRVHFCRAQERNLTDSKIAGSQHQSW